GEARAPGGELAQALEHLDRTRRRRKTQRRTPRGDDLLDDAPSDALADRRHQGGPLVAGGALPPLELCGASLRLEPRRALVRGRPQGLALLEELLPGELAG